MAMSPKAHNFCSYFIAACIYSATAYSRGVHKNGAGNFNGFLACLLWTLHFARRAFETLRLFKFSAKSVPVSDSLQEFLYYWIFSWLIASTVDVARPMPGWQQALGAVVWLLAEGCNAACHNTLSGLKKTQEERSFPPAGGRFLFGACACPHYLFEILSWIGFNVATGFCTAGCVFAAVGAVIMTCYANERHEHYKKLFDGVGGRPLYPKERTPIFPFLDLRPPSMLVEVFQAVLWFIAG
ncbi:unnamed protein product [Polarella glacialis]|uniref:3-oxo-5-alpha-steroid 4-dehydrogenase C-terminal domain-containing protein n=1 Tax=Polarella glacialis TaxID=89957 RepID=A0A813DM65_POLGL|nr:unnamed protein product [Polarella glacialis]